MSLLQQLVKSDSPISSENTKWHTFVIDHLKLIVENGVPILITDEMVSRFQYKIPHLLEANGCKSELMWVALLVNRVNIMDHILVGDLFVIPSLSHIKALYRKFQTSTNNA